MSPFPCLHSSFHVVVPLLPPYGHRYVHVLVQKMAVNADLGFLLAVVAFLSAEKTSIQLEVRELDRTPFNHVQGHSK